jgi:hypothetical protein
MEKTVSKIGILNSNLISDQFFFSATCTCTPHISSSSKLISAWYLVHLKQLIMKTVHILKLDSAGTVPLPGGIIEWQPNHTSKKPCPAVVPLTPPLGFIYFRLLFFAF